MQLFDYLIKVSVCMILFYLPYQLVFRKMTFFSVNRCYLLFISVASLLIPAIHIKIHESFLIHQLSRTITSGTYAYAEDNDPIIAPFSQTGFDWIMMAQTVYWCVCAALLGKLIYGIFQVIHSGTSKGVKTGGVHLVEGPFEKNSSFFNFIFINNGAATTTEREQIIEHEGIHVALAHSFDKVFIEAVKCFFWFNPFAYRIAQSLYEAHEFEVDRILAAKYDSKSYATLLLKLSTPKPLPLVNQLGATHLKSRIDMIFSAPSTGSKIYLYSLLLPLLALLCFCFSVKTTYGIAPGKEDFVLVIDAGHGGDQSGSIGENGIAEKDLNLQIVKHIALAAKESGIRTILTRNNDESVDLAGRAKYKADAFVSIHFNGASAKDKTKNGTTILIDGYNNFQESKKLALNFKATLQQLTGLNGHRAVNVYLTSQDKPLFVLKKNPSPSVLIELGYMSDKNDMDFILNQHNQHQIAEKCIEAIEAYRAVSD